LYFLIEPKVPVNKSVTGVAFIGGEGPAAGQAAALLRESRAALVVAADSGLIALEAAGAKADWIVGDMDSLGEESRRLYAYPQERVRTFPRDKDYTDTELAVSLLREKGCACIWLIGGGGGRLDHLLAIRSLFERDEPPARWVTAREDIRCIKKGERVTLKRPPPAEPVSLFPLGNPPWQAESAGLRWPLSDLPWDRGFFGLGNEAADGAFSIEALEGRFLLCLPLYVKAAADRPDEK
jgi:thiamine pyrophosphokinase